MEYSEKFLAQMVQVGILNYPISKIINVLDVEDVNKFVIDFENKQSQVRINYQKGIDKAAFTIDMMLFNKVKEGDLKALDKYEERMRMYELERSKEQRDRLFK